jgi:DNA-binding SARP family transcriptional activator
MERHDIVPEIRTLGRFSISVNGKPVAAEWPDETIKVFFCSLLSPLDLYFTWDRMCRALWGVPVTRTNKRRLDEAVIQPLNSFLAKELGINPLITGREGIRIDHQGVQIDAHDFYSAVIDGLRLMSLSSNSAALEKFRTADALYTGSYLPELKGKIIENARQDLASLYQSAIKNASWQVHTPVTLMDIRAKF